MSKLNKLINEAKETYFGTKDVEIHSVDLRNPYSQKSISNLTKLAQKSYLIKWIASSNPANTTKARFYGLPILTLN